MYGTIIRPKRIFGNGDTNDEEGFSDFHISRKIAASYERNEHTESIEASSFEKKI